MKTTRPEALVLVAVMLVGIGYLAILPPFEGFDEFAYYSSIRQVADTATLPIYGRSFIDEAVQEYEKHGPMPWLSGNPPFEHPGRLTYPSFFENSAAVKHYKVYRKLPANKRFTPSSEGNWEAQHPPLYFLLMAPIMRATEPLPFITQIFVLRLFSFVLAWSGFVLGWRAMRAPPVPKNNPAGVAVAYLYFPFLVPMFFGEFVRIGNDSLCLLIVSLIFALSLDIFDHENDGVAKPLMLGVLLGLGLLTKAFFIPILASYVIFMTLRVGRVYNIRKLFHRRLTLLGSVTIPALALGGGWYIYEFIAYGSPTGSGDSIFLAQRGGLIANLTQNFSTYGLLRDVIGIAITWSWAGSWSLVRVSPLLHAPLLLFTCALAVSYIFDAWQRSVDDPIWLPIWMLIPFFCGLFYHVLVVLALGTNGTPGWYLNILTPFFAIAFRHGIERIRKTPRGTFFLSVGFAYALLFLLIVLWAQAALFAGCAIKNDDKFYQFSGPEFCLDKVTEVASHLTVFGWPLFASVCIAVGLFCSVVAMGADFLGKPKLEGTLQRLYAPPGG